MAERNSRTTFSSEEYNRIVALVRELEAADSSKQKGIRAKLRKIGLYWSEVASGMPYTVANLQNLFNDGTLKFTDSHKLDEKPSIPTSVNEEYRPTPLRHIKISPDYEMNHYRSEDFDGFIRISELREHTSLLPDAAGVYVVLRTSKEEPQFLEKGAGGFFKGKDPNVSIAELRENFVDGVKTVYIGKATSLRKRVGQLLRFGAGVAVGHWGGRYLWQLADSDMLLIAWKPIPDCDPGIIETQMIRDFTSLHGKRPFANLKD